MSQSEVAGERRAAWQQQVGEMQDRARRAFLARDVAELGRILSDGFVVNSPLNTTLRKGALLDLLQRGVIRHFSYEENVELVERHGSFVFVMGNDVVTNTPAGPPVRRRFTNVWCEAACSWQLVARHAHHLA